jgi:tetratricopeptide (TPR) repeat protein
MKYNPELMRMNPSCDALELCRRAYLAKQWDQVRKIAEEALVNGHSDAFELVNIGIVVRDAQAFDLADKIFTDLITRDADYHFAYYEMSFSYLQQGRHIEAATLLERALEKWPTDHRFALLYMRILHLLDCYPEARRWLSRYFPAARVPDELLLIDAFGRFLRDYPLSKARYIESTLRSKAGNLDTRAVCDLILDAKAQRRPFALIRLGDGEGSYIRLSAQDEVDYHSLYSDNRRQWQEYWFGESIKGHEEMFRKVVGDLTSAIYDADVIGRPLLSWLEHEYAIGSSRGVSSLTNVFRLLLCARENGAEIKLCSQSVHLDLGQIGFFNELLRGEREVGLISCFSELPCRIASNFDVETVKFYKLPGEQHFRTLLGSEATEGAHFPGVFYEIMNKLDQTCAGKIFLVAGGILGKLYARKIKQVGGIALDIGSLADAWVRIPTRPGYEDLKDLALHP